MCLFSWLFYQVSELLKSGSTRFRVRFRQQQMNWVKQREQKRRLVAEVSRIRKHREVENFRSLMIENVVGMARETLFISMNFPTASKGFYSFFATNCWFVIQMTHDALSVNLNFIFTTLFLTDNTKTDEKTRFLRPRVPQKSRCGYNFDNDFFIDFSLSWTVKKSLARSEGLISLIWSTLQCNRRYRINVMIFGIFQPSKKV